MQQFFTRDNIVWNLTFTGALLALAATMLTDWFTPDHARKIGEAAAFLGAAAAKLSNSPLRHSTKEQ